MVSSASVATWEEARVLRDELDQTGKRLVFTNGCFDVLHVGHVRYLNEARSLGDALCVALNADASVRSLKGPHRPINPVEHRAEVLLGLSAVDAVVVFSEARATNAIRAIQPHVYAKGGDYTPESLNLEEREALDDVGAQIEILDLVAGQSTTETLARLGRPEEAKPRALRLGVLGSGRGSTLEGLLAAIDDGRLSQTEVVLVVSDVEDAFILEIARKRGIEAVHVDPGPYKTRLGEPAQKEIRDRFRSAAVDLVILAGFMRRLKTPVLQAFPNRILNVHPSLLPKYPGRAAWAQALAAGESQAGTSIHLVDEGIDSGRLLGQEPVPILPGDTEESLQQRIQSAERELYPRVISEYARLLASPPSCE